MKNNRYDFLIAGAGIIGASVAYNLAKEGYKVAVIDKGKPCGGATGSCNGGVSYLGKTGDNLEKAIESLKIYSDLGIELDADLGLDQTKDMILLGKTAEDEAYIELLVKAANEKGLDANIYTGAKLSSYIPTLRDDVKVAAVAKSGIQGVVNPFKVTYAYLDKASIMKADFIEEEIFGIETSGNKATGFLIDGGVIEGDVLINCAGAEADQLWANNGISEGVYSSKGVVLVTEKYPRLFPGNLLNVDFMKKNPPKVSLAIEQTMSGNLLIGACKIKNDSSLDIPKGLPGEITRNAMSYVSGLEGLEVIRSFVGLRPARDKGFFIGKAGLENLYAAIGFGGSGITMAPYAGRKLKELILG